MSKKIVSFVTIITLLPLEMKRSKLALSKPKRIILVLLLINIISFSTAQSIAEKYSPSRMAQSENKKLNYLEKGWQIFNWSYNLLKYFKKPHTDITG